LDSVSFNYLINAIESENIQLDSFYVSLHDIEYFPHLIGQRPTYNSIISSGRITSFEQDSTFKKLQELYEIIDIQNVSLAGENFYKEYLTPLLNKHSDRSALKYNLFTNSVYAAQLPKVDLNPFRTKEFLNIVYLLKFRIELYNSNDFIIKKSKEIIYEIKKITEEN